MRVLITGASGFVGHWLTVHLRDTGHHPVPLPPDVDVLDADATTAAVLEAQPDAVAHLAAVAFAGDASADPTTAFRVAVAGTINILEAVRSSAPTTPVLITASSEAYGRPHPSDIPLTEATPLRPSSPYALSKAAQEGIALAYGARYGMRVVATRSFNHTGPGQRKEFVVPALAQRVASFAAGRAADIPVGNIDVERDLSDVRDVVDAYRRLLEATAEGAIGAGGLAVNVCSGRSVKIRWVLEELCRLAEVDPPIRVDPALTRGNEAPSIRGDPALIERLTGWRATTPLSRTIADVWASTVQPTLPPT